MGTSKSSYSRLMNFLIRVWFRLRAVKAMLGVRKEVDWTYADSSALKVFLNSQPGQRFINAIRNNALEATVTAVFASAAEIERKSGRAQGLQSAFALVCRLSATDPLKVVRHDGQTSLTESSDDSVPEDKEPFFWGRTGSLGSTIENE
jgi:hypothetical protein